MISNQEYLTYETLNKEFCRSKKTLRLIWDHWTLRLTSAVVLEMMLCNVGWKGLGWGEKGETRRGSKGLETQREPTGNLILTVLTFIS